MHQVELTNQPQSYHVTYQFPPHGCYVSCVALLNQLDALNFGHVSVSAIPRGFDPRIFAYLRLHFGASQ